MTAAKRASVARRPARRGAAGRPRGFAVSREPLTGAAIYEAVTPAGTPVIVRPMPGFSKAYASLTTRFGSLDTHLPDGTLLPVGLAHFLEHKMFATPTGDVFDVYAKRGASANAYTTFSHTTYLFSCTSRFSENLRTLLETLHTMHADARGIEREKGIIGQEIAMYDDDASWRGYFNLLAALYREHPIRLDVAGTRETIAPIDRKVLLATHAAYYHPANLVLVVAGDVDPALVLSEASARLVAEDPGEAHRRAPTKEPLLPAHEERRQALSVSRPQVTLGIKDEPPNASGPALLARETETELLLDVLFGDGGTVEAPLYREGIVDESFGASYQAEPDCAFVAVSAEVDAEAPYRARLLEAIEAARRRGVRAEDLERARRRAIGGYLRIFNAPERIAGALLSLHLKDARLPDAVAALEAATPSRLSERLEALLSRPRAWSVIEPRAAAAATSSVAG